LFAKLAPLEAKIALGIRLSLTLRSCGMKFSQKKAKMERVLKSSHGVDFKELGLFSA
jgi:hypothetical protein